MTTLEQNTRDCGSSVYFGDRPNWIIACAVHRDSDCLARSNWSELESEEADRVWRDCYRPAERIEYIREHASQFEFRSLADILACVRGKYFAGYASELIR